MTFAFPNERDGFAKLENKLRKFVKAVKIPAIKIENVIDSKDILQKVFF